LQELLGIAGITGIKAWAGSARGNQGAAGSFNFFYLAA
jgi:hypothetical protein